MEKEIHYKNISNIEATHKATHEPYEYTKYEITPREDFSQCYVAVYHIPPLKSNYPMHSHENNTEVFYIQSGNGLVETPTGCRRVETGDFIICPPGKGSAHKIKNISETEDLVYIDFDTTNSPDIVHYPDSGKTGIILHNQSSTFFRDSTAVDYYEDE